MRVDGISIILIPSTALINISYPDLSVRLMPIKCKEILYYGV